MDEESIVSLINDCKTTIDQTKKSSLLAQLQEVLLNRVGSRQHFKDYWPSILEFEADPSIVSKKWLVNILPLACKKESQYIFDSVSVLSRLLSHENPQIIKAVIMGSSNIFPKAMVMISQATKSSNSEREQGLWKELFIMKKKICDFLSSANSAICTHSVKFLETFIQICSEPTIDGNVEPFMPGGFNIAMIPENGFFITRSQLKQEGEQVLYLLFQKMKDESLPASNVTALINALTVIVKQRKQFIEPITNILVDYHTNIPENLTKTQKKSITHALKMAMHVILKLRVNGPWNDKLQQCLSGRIAKGVKRKASTTIVESDSKIPKTSTQPFTSVQVPDIVSPTGVPINATTNIHINPQSLYYILQLPLDVVANLVLENIKSMVPHTTPSISTSDPRVSHSQVKPSGLSMTPKELENIPKVYSPEKEKTSHLTTEEPQEMKLEDKQDIEPEVIPPTHTTNVIGNQSIIRVIKSATQKAKRSNNLKASFINDAILSKISTLLPSQETAIQLLLEFLSNSLKLADGDHKNSLVGTPYQAKNIVLYWLNSEYAKLVSDNSEENQQRYEFILSQILSLLRANHDSELIPSIVLNIPFITESVFMTLRDYCESTETRMVGLSTLQDLIIFRPYCREKALNIMLSFTMHQDINIRTDSVRIVSQKKILQISNVYQEVKVFALNMMNSILSTEYETFVKSAEMKEEEVKPQINNEEETMVLENGHAEKTENVQEMNAQIIESDIQKRLLLFMALCLKRQKLLREYLEVLDKTNLPQVRQVMLRIYTDIIRKIGQQSDGLLEILRLYPPNLEKYILRALHILTEKSDPTPELVETVLDVYKNIKSDARLLIFILSGMAREEVISFLPKIVALPKEDLGRAIGRLLDAKRTNPLKPADLLVQLHLISAEQHGLSWGKLVEATQFCFNKTTVSSNKEILASVLQQLVDITPLPHLFMRTVNQTIEKCPELKNFVMGILSRLISKKIWQDELQWRGFVKACSKALPQSIPVILLLPKDQFESTLQDIPNLKQDIVSHLESTGKMNTVPKELQSILSVSITSN